MPKLLCYLTTLLWGDGIAINKEAGERTLFNLPRNVFGVMGRAYAQDYV